MHGRQELTPTPYALALPGLWTRQNGEDVSPSLVGGHDGNVVLPTVVGATISGGGGPEMPLESRNRVFDDYGTIGGGSDNQAGYDEGNPLSGGYATVGGGEGNSAVSNYCTVAGGIDNWAGSC